ncbi:MAG: rhomboid family intramembrane serine protease [Cellvibrionaceae bacterium]
MSDHWHKVEVFNVRLDLSPLLHQLQKQAIAYRVTEDHQGQWLWVGDHETADSLRQWLSQQGQDFMQSPAESDSLDVSLDQQASAGVNFFLRKQIELLGLLRHLPVTIVTILLGVVGALLIEFDSNFQWISWLTFQPVKLLGNQLGISTFAYGWDQLQYWRLLTPVFLHFGFFHILFNSLWIWEFGRRIELHFGGGFLLLAVLVTGVSSNLAQYLWKGPSLFGGLSGVLYALLGFLWVHNRFKPHPITTLPPGIIGFMLFWMVLGMSGAVNAFIDGSVANAAHFGGLISGMLFALLTVQLSRPKSRLG